MENNLAQEMSNAFYNSVFAISNYSCEDTKWFPIFELAKFIIVVIQIAVPFALIIWGSLDWFKALIAHDEKEMRMKRKPFIKRVVAALLVLCLPWLVQLVSNIIADNDKSNSFWTCYSEAKARVDFKSWDDTSWFTDDDEDGEADDWTKVDNTDARKQEVMELSAKLINLINQIKMYKYLNLIN